MTICFWAVVLGICLLILVALDGERRKLGGIRDGSETHDNERRISR